MLGSIGTPHAAQAAREGDLFIVLGSGFRQRNLVPDVPIIQVDINAARVGRSFPVDVGLVGDAIFTVRELTKRVTPKVRDPEYFEKIDNIKRNYQEMILDESKDMSTPINPGFLVQSVKLHADKDAYICVDVGDHTYWFYKKYQCTGEKTLMSSNMVSMGFAFLASLAAQLEYPGRQVICITGDGGFAMVMADFTTAVRNNLPVKVIVFNDGKLKNIKKEQGMYGYLEYGTQFINPDFAAFAESCGGEGYRVDNPEQLDEALQKAFNSDKPALVDVIVDPERMAPIVLRPP
ncbi:MAG: thiamine pyrophosphate-dependent enzyme [ANME-2 cluster archaeon]|nr:thiamine pyrophosphate-dependent enzyme [ANME-2 cluster archaeon]